MPTEIVEGYTASQQAATPAGAVLPPEIMVDPWIANLRQDLRREMIRELALRRIRSGGRENQPSEGSRAGRVAEMFFVGIAVALVSSWVCSQAGKDRE